MGEREPARANTKQRSHADRVTAEQVFLEGQDFCGIDALVGQLAEAGVDAIDRLPGIEQFQQAAACSFDSFAGGLPQSQTCNLAMQDVFCIIKSQAIAGEFQSRAFHTAIIALRPAF